MTVLDILNAVTSLVRAALPGWRVYAEPTPDVTEPRVAEVVLGDVALVPHTIQRMGWRVTVLVGLTVNLRHPGAYAEMVHGVHRIMEAIAATQGVLGSVTIAWTVVAADSPAPVASGPSGDGYWRTVIRIPVEGVVT